MTKKYSIKYKRVLFKINAYIEVFKKYYEPLSEKDKNAIRHIIKNDIIDFYIKKIYKGDHITFGNIWSVIDNMGNALGHKVKETLKKETDYIDICAKKLVVEPTLEQTIRKKIKDQRAKGMKDTEIAKGFESKTKKELIQIIFDLL